jgi:type IV pilus biogenesis protein CpaD/CtpE
MRIDVLFLPIAVLMLAACQSTGNDGLPYLGGRDNFGEANRMTMATQVVDPDPVYTEPMSESPAEHAAQAVDRYRKDKVKKPDRTRTTDSVLGASESK